MHSSGVANGTMTTPETPRRTPGPGNRGSAREDHQPDADCLARLGGGNAVIRIGLTAERYYVSQTIHFYVLRSMRPEVDAVLTDLVLQIYVVISGQRRQWQPSRRTICKPHGAAPNDANEAANSAWPVGWTTCCAGDRTCAASVRPNATGPRRHGQDHRLP